MVISLIPAPDLTWLVNVGWLCRGTGRPVHGLTMALLDSPNRIRC